MKSLLPPEAYISEDWFIKEQDSLMRPLWQFVAPLPLLSQNHAFITRNIAGKSVVVQNFEGEIKAFENSCLHRMAALQTESEGRRPLSCSYHSWSYDNTGAVKHIPLEDSCYRLQESERSSLKLREFAVYVFGKLVFVNINDNAIPFEDQFDQNALASLKAASEHFDDEVLVTTFPVRCNWKLVGENLRDPLHVNFVHTNSLYKQVKFQPNIDESFLQWLRAYRETGSPDRAEHMRILRSFSDGGDNEPFPNMPRYAWHDNVDRYGTKDWYLNWLLFPNLHIASASGGHAFMIVHYQPVSAGRTDMRVHYVTAKKKRPYATSTAVLLAHIEVTEPVLREDIEIMERLQAGMRPGVQWATLGDYESANLVIERWYMDVLEGNHAV